LGDKLKRPRCAFPQGKADDQGWGDRPKKQKKKKIRGIGGHKGFSRDKSFPGKVEWGEKGVRTTRKKKYQREKMGGTLWRINILTGQAKFH